ncbi:MAG: DUF1800 domain-containing protein [Burkholderiaceae bacterium]
MASILQHRNPIDIYRHQAGHYRLLPGYALALLLTACGGNSTPAPPSGGSDNPQILAEQLDEARAGASGTQPGSLPGELPEASAVRFLNQASFGSTEADVANAMAQWRWGWLQTQFSTPVAKTHWEQVLADEAAWRAEDPARAQANTPRVIWDWSVWETYLTSPDQLRKRIAYALSQILVVSMETLPDARFGAGYMDVLEANAFGNFRQLLEDVTLTPAMGQYLSYRGNRKAVYPNNDPTRDPIRVPDENYAREVMQLFTIGLYLLNPDGTLKLVNGEPVETYGEQDVQGLARVFTGWDWQPRTVGEYERLPMRHIANRHSPEEKAFLGVTIAAGTDGPSSLAMALDTLFNHPNTAPFISKQLIQRLVTSNPSTEYVSRVAARFIDNGDGVRGDLRAVIEAVLLDTEARSPFHISAPAPGWGKLREPVLRFTTFARAFGVSNSQEIWRYGDLSEPSTALGQSPLRSPSVFNFYRPGYVPPNTSIARDNLVAPEFQIATETSIPGYVNFMQKQLTNPPAGIRYNFDPELALVNNPVALVARLNRRLTNNAMRTQTQELIINTISALPVATDNQKLNRVRTAILMTLAAPDFVVQK